MSAAPFHLGWFGSFTRGGFAGRWSGSDATRWANGEFHIELAQALERAGFDYMMFEDSLIATASTSFYPPYMLARTLATLSHLSGGRTGWNIVTSSEDRAAQNFGGTNLPAHDQRYDRADEFCEVVNALLSSWEPDAAVYDRATGTVADGDKVHPIDFEGKYFRSRGPLNTLPPVDGRPVYCQAGSSPRGRRFGAEHADTFTGISNRKQLAELTEGLVPELQRRGLTRVEYSHDTLRGNLFAFWPSG
jgi:alkanesulfonate monooxygenase SsuD/methylene tetrahydromethanopterin reductase-like flavin-dependent oxidoreductase (luciferase family)